MLLKQYYLFNERYRTHRLSESIAVFLRFTSKIYTKLLRLVSSFIETLHITEYFIWNPGEALYVSKRSVIKFASSPFTLQYVQRIKVKKITR